MAISLLVWVLVASSAHSFVPTFRCRKPVVDVSAALSACDNENTPAKRPGVHEIGSHRSLYPALPAYANGAIMVDSIHTLVYREYGNPHGLPALFLHGGPGAGCFDNHARFFHPGQYRIILLDQRGAGASQPRAEWRRNNTLLHLVEDCEQLRHELGIERWTVVLGGSWGSTLGLAYAASHPFAMQFLLLRGICFMRRHEVDWIFSQSSPLNDLHPEEWRRFDAAYNNVNQTHNENRGICDSRRALHSHYDRLLGDDPLHRIDAARSWFTREFSVEALNKAELNPNASTLVGSSDGQWIYHDTERNCCEELAAEKVSNVLMEIRRFPEWHSSIQAEVSAPDPILREPALVSSHVNTSTTNATEAAGFVPAQAMLTCFYSVNSDYAMNGVPLLHRLSKSSLRDSVRCIGVHGGLDNICPVDTALDLKDHWPEMELRIPLGAGHSMYDAAITHELIQATDYIADQVKRDWPAPSAGEARVC